MHYYLSCHIHYEDGCAAVGGKLSRALHVKMLTPHFCHLEGIFRSPMFIFSLLLTRSPMFIFSLMMTG
jgi:hypothetical protein